MKKILAVISLISLVGCTSSTQIVSDAEGNDKINTMRLSCNGPYEITQDFIGWRGVLTRVLVIDDFEVKVGASEDGKVVIVMDAHQLKNEYNDPFTWNSKTHSLASNESYQAVRKVLDKNNVEVIKVRSLESFGNIDGYAIELASDGYSVLKPYTK